MATHAELEQSVRAVLAAHGKLTQDAKTIAASQGLFDIGMDSQAVIRVMLAIEEDLDLSFPDDALNRDTFCTIDTIVAALKRATA